MKSSSNSITVLSLKLQNDEAGCFIFKMPCLPHKTYTTKLDAFFPCVLNQNDEFRLSRSSLYYDPKHAIHQFDVLINIYMALAERIPPADLQYSALLSAVLENITNILQALYESLYVTFIDKKNTIDSETFDRIENITLAFCIAHVHAIENNFFEGTYELPDTKMCDEILKIVANINTDSLTFRQFREMDNKFRIISEVKSLTDLIEKENIETVVFLMYGALSYGFYFKAFHEIYKTCSATTHFLRCGFHDLSYLNFDETSPSQLDKAIPDFKLNEVKLSITGKNVLFLDDNYGHGKTMRFCKHVCEEMGGKFFGRSFETSWYLLKDQNCLSAQNIAVMDAPGLRFVYHHSFLERDIKLLERSPQDYADKINTCTNENFLEVLRKTKDFCLNTTILNQRQKDYILKEYNFLRSQRFEMVDIKNYVDRLLLLEQEEQKLHENSH